MSEEEKKEHEYDLADKIVLSNVDWILQYLISLVNEGATGLHVTLSVGGTIISGEMISVKTYLEETGNLLTGAFKRDEEKAKKVFKEVFDEFAQTVGDRIKSDPTGIAYIHLKNVKILSSVGQTMKIEGESYWRGKLASVDGFMPGRFEQAT